MVEGGAVDKVLSLRVPTRIKNKYSSLSAHDKKKVVFDVINYLERQVNKYEVE